MSKQLTPPSETRAEPNEWFSLCMALSMHRNHWGPLMASITFIALARRRASSAALTIATSAMPRAGGGGGGCGGKGGKGRPARGEGRGRRSREPWPYDREEKGGDLYASFVKDFESKGSHVRFHSFQNAVAPATTRRP